MAGPPVQRVKELGDEAKRASAAGLTVPLPNATHFPRCWYTPSKLTLLTVCAGLPANYNSCLLKNRRTYAQRHGLEYCEYTDAPSKLRINFCWHKLIAVQWLLQATQPVRTAIFWLDADALLMDLRISAFDILRVHPSKDFIFAADYNPCDRNSPGARHPVTGPALSGRCEDSWSRRISGGVFMVRNTPTARNRIDYIWTQGASGKKNWGDGGSADNVEFDRWRVNHALAFSQEAVSIDQSVMNSMRKTYMAGDFVFHHAGGGYEVGPYQANNLTNGNPAKYVALSQICATHTLGGSDQQRRDAEAELEKQTVQMRRRKRWPALPSRVDSRPVKRLFVSAVTT